MILLDLFKFYLEEFHLIKYEAELNKEEICGIITNKKIYFTPNISNTPEDNFVIDPKILSRIYTTKDEYIKLCFHSHTKGDHLPSLNDKIQQRFSDLPFLIYSTLTKKFSFYNEKTGEFMKFSLD